MSSGLCRKGRPTRFIWIRRTGSSAASVDTQAPGKNSKVAYYILGAAAMGGTIWGIRKALEPGNEAISPAKP